jgi:hypothetical protein
MTPGRKVLKKEPIIYNENSFFSLSPSGRKSRHRNVDINCANMERKTADKKEAGLIFRNVPAT